MKRNERLREGIIDEFRDRWLKIMSSKEVDKQAISDIRNEFFSLPYGEIALENSWESVVTGEKEVRETWNRIELPTEEIKELYKKGYNYVQLGEMFGVSGVTIRTRILGY